jgi:hypothetical protein
VVDLALPIGDDWLPDIFGDRPGPSGSLRFAAEDEPDVCRGTYLQVKLREIDIPVKRERLTTEIRCC